jgi:ribosome-binding protein aMBF1 (putative translation factor)
MQLPPKYVKHIDGRLWELRMKGKDGIARAFYVIATAQRLVIVRVFTKKTQTTAPRETGQEMGRGDQMSKETKKLRKKLSHVGARTPPMWRSTTRSSRNFHWSARSSKPRAEAGLTQEQLAKRMKISQAVVARLESGRSLPSMRTLDRFAKATGCRLKISFERA